MIDNRNFAERVKETASDGFRLVNATGIPKRCATKCRIINDTIIVTVPRPIWNMSSASLRQPDIDFHERRSRTPHHYYKNSSRRHITGLSLSLLDFVRRARTRNLTRNSTMRSLIATGDSFFETRRFGETVHCAGVSLGNGNNNEDNRPTMRAEACPPFMCTRTRCTIKWEQLDGQTLESWNFNVTGGN